MYVLNVCLPWKAYVLHFIRQNKNVFWNNVKTQLLLIISNIQQNNKNNSLMNDRAGNSECINRM